MQHINNTPADSGLGDTLKVAFDKVNANFNELVAIDSSFSGDIQTLNTIISDGSTLNHTHTISQIIGLQTALSGKVSTSTFNTQILAINASIQAINTTLSTIIDILTQLEQNKVPYTGATKNVDLGSFGLSTDYTQFRTTTTGTIAVGKMQWNDTDGTVDLGLKGGNVTLQIGQESVVRVVNKTATNITLLESNYQAVRVTGAQGQRLKVDLALANNDLNSAETIGLVTETIPNNQEGFITTSGLINKINTTGSLQGETWNDGDILYLSPTVAGRITNIKPSAPNHLVIIGYVIYSHSVNGKIFIKVDNGYELDELHNVQVSGATNGQVLTYQASNGLWIPTTISSTGGSTFTGGTVSGATRFTNGLTANTFSATTYQNLPLDVRVTGGTYSNGTATFRNNTGGTFNVTGFATQFTGGTVPGFTNFTNNGGIQTKRIYVVDQSDGLILGDNITSATAAGLYSWNSDQIIAEWDAATNIYKYGGGSIQFNQNNILTSVSGLFTTETGTNDGVDLYSNLQITDYGFYFRGRSGSDYDNFGYSQFFVNPEEGLDYYQSNASNSYVSNFRIFNSYVNSTITTDDGLGYIQNEVINSSDGSNTNINQTSDLVSIDGFYHFKKGIDNGVSDYSSISNDRINVYFKAVSGSDGDNFGTAELVVSPDGNSRLSVRTNDSTKRSNFNVANANIISDVTTDDNSGYIENTVYNSSNGVFNKVKQTSETWSVTKDSFSDIGLIGVNTQQEIAYIGDYDNIVSNTYLSVDASSQKINMYAAAGVDVNGTLKATTISATTYQNLPSYAEFTDLQVRRNGFVLFDDLLTIANGTTPFIKGTVASGQSQALGLTIDNPGVLRVNSTTTVNSGGYITYVNSAAATSSYLTNNTRFDAIISLGPTPLATTTIRAGLIRGTVTVTDANEGCYFEIINTGIVGKTANGGVRSSTASFTLTANTFYHLRVIYNSTTLNTFEIYDMNGTLLSSNTLSTNISLGTQAIQPTFIATNSSASAQQIALIDYISITYPSYNRGALT